MYGVCTGVRGCARVCTCVRSCACVCSGVSRCAWVYMDVCRCLCGYEWECAGVCGWMRVYLVMPWCTWVFVGIHGCVRVCVGVQGCVRVCVGMCGCLWYEQVCACVWDEFSEFLLETRVLISADFNMYPIWIFFFMTLVDGCSSLAMGTNEICVRMWYFFSITTTILLRPCFHLHWPQSLGLLVRLSEEKDFRLNDTRTAYSSMISLFQAAKNSVANHNIVFELMLGKIMCGVLASSLKGNTLELLSWCTFFRQIKSFIRFCLAFFFSAVIH